MRKAQAAVHLDQCREKYGCVAAIGATAKLGWARTKYIVIVFVQLCMCDCASISKESGQLTLAELSGRVLLPLAAVPERPPALAAVRILRPEKSPNFSSCTHALSAPHNQAYAQLACGSSCHTLAAPHPSDVALHMHRVSHMCPYVHNNLAHILAAGVCRADFCWRMMHMRSNSSSSNSGSILGLPLHS